MTLNGAGRPSDNQTGYAADLTAHLRALAPAPRLAAVLASVDLVTGVSREALLHELAGLAAPVRKRRVIARIAERLAAPAEPPHERALLELVARWTDLPDTARDRAVSLARGQWGRLADELARDPSHRAALPELTESVREPELVRTLPALLCAGEGVSADAERAMVRLARELHAEPGLAQAYAIIDAIADASATFNQHRRRGPVVAAVLLLGSRAGCPPRLRSLVSDPDHPAAKALRGATRYSNMPAVRAQAWRWMTADALGAASLDRLVRAVTDEDHEAVLRLAHLALNPMRAHRLRLVEARGRVARVENIGGKAIEVAAPIRKGPLPDPDRIGALSPAARRGLPRFTAALAGPTGVKRSVTDPLLGDSDESVRTAAMLSASPADLAEFCFDDAEPIARSASLRWSVCGSGLTGAHQAGAERRLSLCARLSRSAHRSVRRIASDDLARLDTTDGRAPASRVAAMRSMEADPGAQIRLLSEAITAGDAARRVGAIMMARSVRVVDEVSQELCSALGAWPDGDVLVEPRVAATAAAALGDASGAESWRALIGALASGDPRVRANAAEALGRRDLEASRDRLVELRTDDRHRVRAGAVRALLADGPSEASAAESLASMMGDDRAEHRLAGAWLAERTLSGRGVARLGIAWPELARRLEVLAIDKDDAVRARASRALGRVTRVRRMQWARGGSSEALA